MSGRVCVCSLGGRRPAGRLAGCSAGPGALVRPRRGLVASGVACHAASAPQSTPGVAAAVQRCQPAPGRSSHGHTSPQKMTPLCQPPPPPCSPVRGPDRRQDRQVHPPYPIHRPLWLLHLLRLPVSGGAAGTPQSCSSSAAALPARTAGLLASDQAAHWRGGAGGSCCPSAYRHVCRHHASCSMRASRELTSVGASSLPCPCSMKVGTPETNPAPSPSPVPTSGASDNTIWWPTDAQVTPSDVGEPRAPPRPAVQLPCHKACTLCNPPWRVHARAAWTLGKCQADAAEGESARCSQMHSAAYPHPTRPPTHTLPSHSHSRRRLRVCRVTRSAQPGVRHSAEPGRRVQHRRPVRQPQRLRR